MHRRKTIAFIFFMVISRFSFAGFTKTAEIFIDPNKIHVPLGFDSNDLTEIIITGEFRDTCHRQPFGEVKIIDKEIIIHLKALHTFDENIECVQTIVPYMVSMPVGQLPEGNYTITINPSQKTEKKSGLYITSPRSNDIDNFTYANVTQVTKTRNRTALSIKGVHPNSCMEIDRIETIQNDTGDTITVLPIIKQTDIHCGHKIKPFVYELPIPDTKGVVFHVRKNDGQAINLR